MTRFGLRRRPAALLGLVAALALASDLARAQPVDCAVLRDEIAARAADPGRFDAALRQQRDEIARTRAYADRTGCGDGFFDDPDSPACRALARRVGALEIGLQRLQDQAARGDPPADDRRRALQDRFDAACSALRADDGTPLSTLPVDPTVPAGPAAAPRAATVLCVRHCDGAYYPLAVEVASGRMAEMDRICQAQCPAAEASAYAGDGADNVSEAVASDGTRYAALATAFQFRKGPTNACACRAPHQSWAEALAGAEAMIQPHKGDVTVTAALAASMAQPLQPPRAAPPAVKPAAAAPKKPQDRKPAPPLLPAVPAPDPDRDLTRAFRRSDPTL